MKRALLCLLILSTVASADSDLPEAAMANVQLEDPAKERQAKALMETIRCLVCQGQSIADSDAEMAGDMRSLIRKRIAAGESPDAVRDWLVQRYGTYVTYEPPFTGLGGPVWIAPILLLIAGIGVASSRFRKRRG